MTQASFFSKSGFFLPPVVVNGTTQKYFQPGVGTHLGKFFMTQNRVMLNGVKPLAEQSIFHVLADWGGIERRNLASPDTTVST